MNISTRNKWKLGLTLFFLGFLGVLSMLTVSLPVPPEGVQKISPMAIKVLLVVQPSFVLLLAVIAGTMLHTKVGLSVPTISAILKIEAPRTKFVEQLKYGALLGVLSSLLVMAAVFIFQFFVPQELAALNANVNITPVARLCYGGLTEELLLRFGFMTFAVWLASKFTKNLNRLIYWTGIAVSTLVFAVGHFPAVFAAVAHPSALLLAYILIGNSIGGLAFGWLYWKKGLEAACIAHMFFHVVVILAGLLGFQQ
ncbi:MAG: CPBP family intramembrane metalloprotease [Prevotellaceae bacterium]|nr:CPBP family intramembrane metalloprotease [Prevotellaceae bacterium]